MVRIYYMEKDIHQVLSNISYKKGSGKMSDLPILLAIDPSVRSLGWAIVNLNKIKDKYSDDIGRIRSGREVDLTGYCDLSIEGLWSYDRVQMQSTKGVDPSIVKYRWKEAFTGIRAYMDLEGIEPTHFASEWPTFFNSTKGYIAATQNYTVGLASMVGYLAGQFNFKSEHITLWTPLQWKGSVPKHVTANRFIQAFGESAEKLSRILSDDIIDAIMIARYWLTLYERQKFRWQNVESHY